MTTLPCTKCQTAPRLSSRRDRCAACDPWCRACETRERKGASRYCGVCQAARRRTWYKTDASNRAARLASNKAGNDALRSEMVAAYGGRCACPGCDVTEQAFLTVDHIENDGAEHRRNIGRFGGIQFYRYLRAQGFPRDRYQLLCWNCNLAKHIYGSCPHAHF